MDQRITLSLLAETLLSVDNLSKQFGPRSGPTEHGPDLDPYRLTLWLCALKDFFFEKVDFVKFNRQPENSQFAVGQRMTKPTKSPGAPSKDFDQLGHQHNQIRVCAVHYAPR